MFRNVALFVVAVLLPASPAPNWPTSYLPEPELLAGVEPCKCVDIRQCPAVLDVLKRASGFDRQGLVELNRLKRSTCAFHGFVPFVCCPVERPLESRINLTPNMIANDKKSYSANHDYHHSNGPSFSSYPFHDQSRPLSLDDREDTPYSGNSETSFDQDENSYWSEEVLGGQSNTHYANHPPHVHKPSTSAEQSSETRNSQRCKPPINVSVFSRGGVKELRQFNSLCDVDGISHDKPHVVMNTSEILMEIQRASSSPSVRLLPRDQCGITVDERIVGGKEAQLGAFPWIARIGYIRNGSNRKGPFLYRCGGSLLNARYVLTAAHCVTNLPGTLELATVRLGEHDERTDPDCKTPTKTACAEPVQDFHPESVIIHPHYDRPKYSNDLALIRLNRPANISTYVSPICLPLGELGIKNYTGSKATVAGWGATHPGLTSSSPVLQWVRLSVMDSRQCAEAYESAEVEVDAWRQLCAGGESMTDSCDGDSGGPLMRPEQPTSDSLPRYFLVGVVSFGAKICGTESMPGVYTRVAAYLRWIIEELRP